MFIDGLGVADGTLVMLVEDSVAGRLELRDGTAVLTEANVKALESTVVLMNGGTRVDSGTGKLEVTLADDPGILNDGVELADTVPFDDAGGTTDEANVGVAVVALPEFAGILDDGAKVGTLTFAEDDGTTVDEFKDTPCVEKAGGSVAIVLPKGGGKSGVSELVALADEGGT
jgi:hypothetical protein